MSKPQPFSWKNSRILIADDEPDMREIFSAWFRNLGCIVTEAADGKEALDAIARERFDVIVTDVPYASCRRRSVGPAASSLRSLHSGRHLCQWLCGLAAS